MIPGAERGKLHVDGNIATLKRELFRRPVPSRNQDLINAMSQGFYLSTTAFSERLLTAITKESLYAVDQFGRRRERPADEIGELLLRDQDKPFGRVVRQAVAGRDFFDLGCGDPNASKIPPKVAEVYRAERYVGVDVASVTDAMHTVQLLDGGSMPVAYLQMDMLAFVSQLEPGAGKVFYISGIEPFKDRDDNISQGEKFNNPANDYTDALLEEIQRVTVPGDSIIIGQGTHGFNPDRFGFTLTQKVEAQDSGDNTYLVQGVYTKD